MRTDPSGGDSSSSQQARVERPLNPQMDDRRREMVERQIRARGIRDQRVLEAMLDIPRHLFAPADLVAEAYSDQPLTLGREQTISQPFMVAAMSEALELTGGERVLEIGTGSGYQAAVLARLAKEVFSVEVDVVLAESARQQLQHLGFSNVVVITGDGSAGLPEHAPYDGIIVTAAAPAIPLPLIEQLADGGRLVIPVAAPGEPGTQELIRLRRNEATNVGGNRGSHTQEVLQYCRFVPLLGRYGWREMDR